MDPVVRPSLSPHVALVYEAAVGLQAASVQAIAEHTELEPAVVVAEIECLTGLGLLEVADGAVLPLAPRLPLERLAAQHAREAELARHAASTFADLWSAAAQRNSFIEVIDDEERAATVERELMHDAVVSVDGLCTGPVTPQRLPPGMDVPEHQVIDGFFEAIERGVRIRGLYGFNTLEDTMGLAVIQRCVGAGEEARVLPEVPLHLVIVDGKRAFCSVPGQGGARRHLVVVHESGLTQSLVRLYEILWQLGVPFTRAAPDRHGPDGPRSEDRQLLAYLAAGLTDEAIARDLGISPRTLGRRITRMEELLGARGRFQLAVQASRRGWL